MYNEIEIKEYRVLADCLTYVGDRKRAFNEARRAARLLKELDEMADMEDKNAFGWKASRRKSHVCVSKAERRYFRK